MTPFLLNFGSSMCNLLLLLCKRDNLYLMDHKKREALYKIKKLLLFFLVRELRRDQRIHYLSSCHFFYFFVRQIGIQIAGIDREIGSDAQHPPSQNIFHASLFVTFSLQSLQCPTKLHLRVTFLGLFVPKLIPQCALIEQISHVHYYSAQRE